mmetsp:Transcript_67040/g.119284  ORF Transcript_67040/g.119284 Transcript_67040/m.119284 type:complete len:148 (-) Transcript_67040:117-560(-)
MAAQGTVVQGTVVQQGMPVAYGQPTYGQPGYGQPGGGMLMMQPAAQQEVWQRKPRTLLDPCPVNWPETPMRRCLRYALAAVIVGGMVLGAIILLYSLTTKTKECDELKDDKAACEANPDCNWYGEGGAEAFFGNDKASWSGENCARK